MDCGNVDKVKPLDKLLDDQIKEFESGKDRVCDPELDKMMWELGDYENEEPKMEAKEFADDKPIEEDLVEKKVIFDSDEKPYYIEGDLTEKEFLAGDEVVSAHSMSPDSGK
jgi:hypothetical protein